MVTSFITSFKGWNKKTMSCVFLIAYPVTILILQRWLFSLGEVRNEQGLNSCCPRVGQMVTKRSRDLSNCNYLVEYLLLSSSSTEGQKDVTSLRFTVPHSPLMSNVISSEPRFLYLRTENMSEKVSQLFVEHCFLENSNKAKNEFYKTIDHKMLIWYGFLLGVYLLIIVIKYFF